VPHFSGSISRFITWFAWWFIKFNP